MTKTDIGYWDRLGVRHTPSILDVSCGEVRVRIYNYEGGTRGGAMVHPGDGVLHSCLGSCRWLTRMEQDVSEFELQLNE